MMKGDCSLASDLVKALVIQCGNADNNANGNNGSNGDNGVKGENNPIHGDIVTSAPLAPMALLNGNVSFAFHTHHCTLKSMTLPESLVPLASLTPMASMTPMNRHSHQWIANVSNGAIDTIGIDEANGPPML